MEESNWKEQLLALVRKPATALVLVLLLGIGVDLSFSFWKVLPLAERKSKLSQQASNIEAQVRIQEQKPIPAKVKASDFDPLLKQVPVGTGMPDFLLELHGAETASGVVLSNLSVAGAGVATKEDALLSAFTAQTKVPASTPGTGAAATTPKPAASAAPGGTGIFSATSLTLQLKGTYEQIRDFVIRLYQMERVVNIQHWQYTANGSTPATSPTPAIGKGTKPTAYPVLPDQPVVQMTMTLDIYNAKTYANQLQDPPSAIQPSPALREDPTMMDERFQQLLESLSSAVVR